MKTVRWAVLALCVIGGGFVSVRFYQVRTAATVWAGPAAEILSETFDKQDDTLRVELTSRLDAPVARVMRALTEPERSREFDDAVSRSELVRHHGNRKVVAFEIRVLGRPQESVLAFTFLPRENRVLIETVENQLTELRGEYILVPSPDGTKTLLTYRASATDKTHMPIPVGMQKSAMREAFVLTLRSLKKGLGEQQAHTQS